LRGGELENLYVILGLAPGALWLGYLSWRAQHRAGSFSTAVKVFFAGCICTVPPLIIEFLAGTGPWYGSLVRAAEMSFLVVGPLEEFFKLVAVWLTVYRSDEFKESIDGMLYAATAAIGFACVENMVYIGVLGPQTLASRALYATPAHVMFSCMWGYSLGKARFLRAGELWTVGRGFVLAAFFHGVYNFTVAVHPQAALYTLVPLMGVMAWLLLRRILDFRRRRPFPTLGEDPLIYCPNCGAYMPESASNCSRCGSEIPPMEIDAPRFCCRCRAQLDPCRETCSACGQWVELSRLCPPA
jgi:protease PrsW